MLRQFTGTHDHRLDDKGRVSLPTEFRRVLAAVGSSGALYIVPQLRDPRAHVVFTLEAYEAMIERHNETEYPTFAQEQRAETMLIARASQIQVDDNGRMVIARALREAIGLERDVRFVGSGSVFDIWKPEGRAAFEDEQVAEDATPIRFNLRGLHR